MKIEVKNGAVVATSQNAEEALKLISFTKEATAPTVGKLGRKAKGEPKTEAEVKADKARKARLWYKKNKAKKAAAKALETDYLGEPVAINKIAETTNSGQ